MQSGCKELVKALGEVNVPDHLVDIDKAENFEALRNDRYSYSEWLRIQGKSPKDIGFLPLIDSCNHVPELYRLEKTARWDANNRNPESRKFVQERLAAGTQMLANLWDPAWLGSANARLEGR